MYMVNECWAERKSVTEFSWAPGPQLNVGEENWHYATLSSVLCCIFAHL